MRCDVRVKNVGVGAARVVGFLSLFMAAGRVTAEALPETAAGRQMAAWLAAVNSGDKEQMRAFEAANGPGAADPARVDVLLESYASHYRARSAASREPLFAGALEALDRLQAMPETILAVATGKGYTGAVTLLEHHGIVGRFDDLQRHFRSFRSSG